MPEQTFFVVCDRDGNPLFKYSGRARTIAVGKIVNMIMSWADYEKQGYTCREFRLVPVEPPVSEGGRMADDPMAERCPKCGCVRRPCFAKSQTYICGTQWIDALATSQSQTCWIRELQQQLAAMTEKANARLCRACLELHPIDGQCVPHEARTTGQAWFRERLKDLGDQLATVTAERDQLRVMAGLLEQSLSVTLPDERHVYRDHEWDRVLGKVAWRISNCTVLYPTAIAAIRAGMGWDREEKP